MAVLEELPPELISRVFKHLSIPEQMKLGALRRQFREHLPISVLCHDTQLSGVRNVPAFGFYSWQPLNDAYQGLCLDLPRRNCWFSSHAWVDANIPLGDALSDKTPGMFFRFKMAELRPNGGYCSLLLRRPASDPGYLEIKFDDNSLRGYGGEVTKEDFGIPTQTVRAERWLYLQVRFDWESRRVKLVVDGVLIKTLQLNDSGWDGVHSVVLRDYTFSPHQAHTQAWSHILVERK